MFINFLELKIAPMRETLERQALQPQNQISKCF